MSEEERKAIESYWKEEEEILQRRRELMAIDNARTFRAMKMTKVDCGLGCIVFYITAIILTINFWLVVLRMGPYEHKYVVRQLLGPEHQCDCHVALASRAHHHHHHLSHPPSSYLLRPHSPSFLLLLPRLPSSTLFFLNHVSQRGCRFNMHITPYHHLFLSLTDICQREGVDSVPDEDSLHHLRAQGPGGQVRVRCPAAPRPVGDRPP